MEPILFKYELDTILRNGYFMTDVLRLRVTLRTEHNEVGKGEGGARF
jgi:hypothetical protein